MPRSKAALIVSLTVALAAPVFGQQPASNDSQKQAVADPNARICEDIVQTGSRIATKRFCATKAEWEDKRRQDREAVEKAQLSPCVLTHTEVGANGNGHQAC